MTTALIVLAFGFANEVKPLDFTFEDQFEAKQQLKDYRGIVVVLVYGDRKASDECRQLGEALHVALHPTAKDLPPGKARQAPAIELAGLPAGKQSPGVLVQAVACCGKLPSGVKKILCMQLAKAAPETPVWLDCESTMVDNFGLMTGQANVVVLDGQGRFRHSIIGTPSPKDLKALMSVVESLRREAVK